MEGLIFIACCGELRMYEEISCVCLTVSSVRHRHLIGINKCHRHLIGINKCLNGEYVRLNQSCNELIIPAPKSDQDAALGKSVSSHSSGVNMRRNKMKKNRFVFNFSDKKVIGRWFQKRENRLNFHIRSGDREIVRRIMIYGGELTGVESEAVYRKKENPRVETCEHHLRPLTILTIANKQNADFFLWWHYFLSYERLHTCI